MSHVPWQDKGTALPYRLLSLSALVSALVLLVYTDFRSCHNPLALVGLCPARIGRGGVSPGYSQFPGTGSSAGRGQNLPSVLSMNQSPCLYTGRDDSLPITGLVLGITCCIQLLLPVCLPRWATRHCPQRVGCTQYFGWAWADWALGLAKLLI